MESGIRQDVPNPCNLVFIPIFGPFERRKGRDVKNYRCIRVIFFCLVESSFKEDGQQCFQVVTRFSDLNISVATFYKLLARKVLSTLKT